MKNHLTNTILRKLPPVFLCVMLALFLVSGNAVAVNVKLSWNDSKSANLGGYILSYGPNSHNYTTDIEVGKANSYVVTDLQEGEQYYFAVKSYDLDRTMESDYSYEFNMTVPFPAVLSADYTASETRGHASFDVIFMPITGGAVTNWKWEFEGSYTPIITGSIARAVTVTYPNPGEYSVSLTVTGFDINTRKSISSLKTSTMTKENFITVLPPPPPPLADAPPPPPPVSQTTKMGLVAAYGFEEISGDIVADASGNGNHGIIKGAGRVKAGHYGRALQFDGLGDWVTVKDSASLALSTGLTLEAWVYPDSVTGRGKTVIMKESPDGAVYNLYASEDSEVPLSSFNDGDYNIISGTYTLPVKKWTHIVATYDGKYQRLYLNGFKVAKKPQNTLILQSDGLLRIGGNSVWGEYFEGYIDEVRIYNRALNYKEVRYNLKTAIDVSNPPQFVIGNVFMDPWVENRPQGTAEAFQMTPQKSGVVTNVQVYLDWGTTATELVAGIYDDDKGHPGRLITQGKLSDPVSGAWNSVPIPVALIEPSQNYWIETNSVPDAGLGPLIVDSPAQPYWIAILGTKGQIEFLEQLESGTGLMETSVSNTLTKLPRRWLGLDYKTNATMSVYGNGY